MKSEQTLREEARRVLDDTEHVIWHAIAIEEKRLKDQAFAEPSPEGMKPYYYDVRALRAIKKALRIVAGPTPKLKAMNE